MMPFFHLWFVIGLAFVIIAAIQGWRRIREKRDETAEAKRGSERREQRAQLSTNFKAVVDEARSYREAKLWRGRDLSRAVRCSFLKKLIVVNSIFVFKTIGRERQSGRNTAAKSENPQGWM